MTKRDFELIARVIRAAREDQPTNFPALNRVSDLLARELSASNPRFDRERFLKACGVAS